ncbi:MAG: hypothetical protein R3F02_02275 [Thiolinea sp.]
MAKSERYSLEQAARTVNRMFNKDWDWRRLLQVVVSEKRYIQVLCWGDEIPVKEIEPVYADFNDFIRRTICPLEHEGIYGSTGIDAHFSGEFFPSMSDCGNDYLKALAYGEHPKTGITRIQDRDEMTIMFVDNPDGYRPTQERLFIEDVSLAVLLNSIRESRRVVVSLPENERQEKYRSIKWGDKDLKTEKGFVYITLPKAGELLALNFGGDDALQMAIEGFEFALVYQYNYDIRALISSGKIEQYEEHTKYGWRRTPEIQELGEWRVRDFGWVRAVDIEKHFNCDLSGWIGQNTRKIRTRDIENAAKERNVSNKHIGAIIDLYTVLYEKNPKFDFSTVEASSVKDAIGFTKEDMLNKVNERMTFRGLGSDSLYDKVTNFDRNVFRPGSQILRVLHGGMEKIK